LRLGDAGLLQGRRDRQATLVQRFFALGNLPRQSFVLFRAAGCLDDGHVHVSLVPSGERPDGGDVLGPAAVRTLGEIRDGSSPELATSSLDPRRTDGRSLPFRLS